MNWEEGHQKQVSIRHQSMSTHSWQNVRGPQAALPRLEALMPSEPTGKPAVAKQEPFPRMLDRCTSELAGCSGSQLTA